MSRRIHRPPTESPTAIAYPDLLAFLEDPRSYPHVPGQVRLIHTHASIVAIASPWVYKVKKPVNLGFLDFSTVERRKHYCEEEVRLNRRLCSRIYEDVVPIFLRNGALTFEEGDGEPVEYAVKMRELEDGYFLDQLLAEAEGPVLLDPLVEVLGRFYLAQGRRFDLSEWGRPERLRINTDENFEQTKSHVGAILPRPAFAAIRLYTDRFYETRAALLKRRCTEGRILDCHGDLRTEHVHVSPDGLCIYDCIEFNERFRYIDVANDVAFLAMDLDFQGHPDLARYVVEQMAAVLDDPALPILADFYMCYRAYVRGKVDCMRSTEPEVSPAEQEASRDRARRYFQVALRYAVAGSEPVVLVVMGGVGAGKSTQARYLSGLLGLPVFSSDRIRKELAGVPLHERGDAETRRRLYAPEQTERTYAALAQHAIDAAGRGRGCILDATYSKAADRARLQQALSAAGIPVRFIELTASDAVIHARLEARSRSDGEVSDARLEDLSLLTARYEAPAAEEGLDLVTVCAEGDLEETALEILLRLITTRALTDEPVLAPERAW